MVTECLKRCFRQHSVCATSRYDKTFVGKKCSKTVGIYCGDKGNSLKHNVLNFQKNAEVPKPRPVKFSITPDSLENVKKSSVKSIPKFKIAGSLDSALCNINKPFLGTYKVFLLIIHFCRVGELVVEEADAVIKSIEVQLVRVETCGCADGYAKEATEIQNIQIADGDVCRNLPIPIFMVFPRLFTCPTLATRTFKIEFECNLGKLKLHLL